MCRYAKINRLPVDINVALQKIRVRCKREASAVLIVTSSVSSR